jgi:hypothetical protein
MSAVNLMHCKYQGCNDTLFPQAIRIAIFDMYYDAYHDSFTGNCNYSLKSMLVDMGAAMFFLYEVAYVLADIINI